jgi:menaquinone-9 beta-reductase
MKLTEVCIIGAGPAGLIASMYLSKHEIPHIIVDKAQFPRHKVCGECYDGRVTRIFNEIDENLIPEMLKENIIQTTKQYTLLKEPMKAFHIIFPEGKRPSRIQTNRYHFDLFLLDYVKKSKYVQVFENQMIANIEHTENGIKIEGRHDGFSVEAKLLLLACGSESRLSERFLNDKRPESHNHFIFLRGYFKLKATFPNKSVSFYYERKPFTHAFVFCPTPNNLVNVELAISKKDYLENKPDMKQLLYDFVYNKPEVKAIFEGAEEYYSPLGTSLVLHNPAASFAGERFMIIGDAAFSSNPLAGLGVGQAVTMAKLAALKAVEALQNNDCSSKNLQSYDKEVNKRFATELRQGKLVTFLLKSPRFMDSIFSLATSYPIFSTLVNRLLRWF